MNFDTDEKVMLNEIASRRRAQQLFSIEELAAFLGTSVRSIRRMHAAGIAPTRIRRSRRLMYPVGDVLEWLRFKFRIGVRPPDSGESLN